MIRNTTIDAFHHDPNFPWRGAFVTRIENLSDIIFAIGIEAVNNNAATVMAVYATGNGIIHRMLHPMGPRAGFLWGLNLPCSFYVNKATQQGYELAQISESAK